MHKRLFIVLLVAVVAVLGIGQSERSDAAFHIMRIYGVMGGATGDAAPPYTQYVELRQAAGGQNFVASHDLCFFDAAGAPWARFTFPSSVPDGTNGASILVGTSEFDSRWAVGNPDFIFSSVNTVAINGSADVDHPVFGPSGKVSFGSDSASIPAMMCAGSFTSYDSVAFGTGYTGTVNIPPKFASDLPTATTDAIVLATAVVYPGTNNSTNYALTDVNTVGEHPRNNDGDEGPIGPPDTDDDDDGVEDVDDNCPEDPNPGQEDVDGDDIGDVCDTEGPSPNDDGVAGGDDCADDVDNDDDGDTDEDDPGCDGPDSDGDGITDVIDNCPSWPNPGQGLPSWPVPPNDPDCDGFTTAAETSMGTNPNDSCGFGAGAPPQSENWPPDLVESNNINISDVLALKPVFGLPGPPARLDLVPSGTINISDVLALKPVFTGTCTP